MNEGRAVTPEEIAEVIQKLGFPKPKISVEEAWPVKDFTSLDQHPELVLYEGYREKGSDRVFLERRAAPKPQPQ
jgi:hypothetical protein